MVVIHTRSKRKLTGGRYTNTLSKRKHMKGNEPTLTKLSETKKKTIRAKGGSQKNKLLAIDKVNLYDAKTNKSSVVKMTSVEENPANRHYVRRNILTKGTIVLTEKGKAKITNRPGQEAAVNAVLIE